MNESVNKLDYIMSFSLESLSTTRTPYCSYQVLYVRLALSLMDLQCTPLEGSTPTVELQNKKQRVGNIQSTPHIKQSNLTLLAAHLTPSFTAQAP